MINWVNADFDTKISPKNLRFHHGNSVTLNWCIMRILQFLILCVFIHLGGTLSAQNDIAPAMQAAIYKKILSLDRNLQKKERGKILFISDNLSVNERELAKSFKELSINSLNVKKSEFQLMDLKTVIAVYINEREEEISEKCITGNVLIICNTDDLIKNGSAGICLSKIEGKVKPVINETILNKSGLSDIVTALSKTAIIIR